jgi:hypothetical protein
MNIEAKLDYKHAGGGIKLPEYLVRMTHHDASGLGAVRFEVGEQLTVKNCLDGIESYMRTLSKITNDLQRDNQRSIALELCNAVLQKKPAQEIQKLAELYYMGAGND